MKKINIRQGGIYSLAILSVGTLALALYQPQKNVNGLKSMPLETKQTTAFVPRQAAVTNQKSELPAELPISDSTKNALAKTWKLQHKALLSREETRQYETLVSKPEVISESAKLLRSPKWAALESAQAMKRLQAINLLEAAVRLNAGPARDLALQEIEATILTNWSGKALSSQSRRLILGDQVELIRVLLQHEPQRAETLEVRAELPIQKRLFSYAKSIQAKESLRKSISLNR